MAEGGSSQSCYDPSQDPKRKAKSKDPGWKNGFWPDLTNKDLVQCSLCQKQMHSGIKRLKQHLVGCYGDVTRCPKTTAIMTEMREYLRKGSHKSQIVLDDDDEDDGNDEGQGNATQSSTTSTVNTNFHPSFGTAAKRKVATSKFFDPKTKIPKASTSIASMLRKTPEEVVEERHSKGAVQTTLEQSTKSKEERDKVSMHIADFFFENGISFNAANSRSYEIMVESIGQYGPGLKPPSYHELRVPLLERAKKETDKIREKHEVSWAEHGCTLMSDGWTDTKNRHLINFLVNSPSGTFFLNLLMHLVSHKMPHCLLTCLKKS